MPDKVKFINRELSWLSFNERVLQEAEDPRVPLLERVKFLGIFSNNLDEFFRVRVASVKRMADMNEAAKKMLDIKPDKVLRNIQERVLNQRHEFDRIYANLLNELAEENIFIINEAQLTEEQGEFVITYFRQKIRPALVPVMLQSAPVFPSLRDREIYLAVLLTGTKNKYALIDLPTDTVPRFLVLPPKKGKHFVILIDDVIRYCLHEIFYHFKYEKAEAYTIKITRDAELDIDQDINESFMQKISKSIKQRKRGRPVRFIHDEKIPQDLLNFLLRKLKISKKDNIIPGGRYHNFRDFMGFPAIGPDRLRYTDMPPLPHPELPFNESLFGFIKKKDHIIHYPYQTYNYVTDFLREAAIDPLVVSIKMTLYRVARNSNVVNALINAIKNGKEVTVVVELQARFDEEANIYWATKLREEGAKVIFGAPNLKVHAKLCLITRKERGRDVKYAYIATGNFNEVTSRTYSDHGLFTANPKLVQEVSQVFDLLRSNLRKGEYKHLLIAPRDLRERLIKLIDTEIKNAKAGKKAYMVLKMNSLVDHEMIEKLYQASNAGVKIKLIVRGICCLKAGVKKMSENIEAISIIDRFLEHSRIFVFCNNGREKIYFGSADMMTRNLNHRIEVVCPIYDENIKKQLRIFLAIQLSGNTKARILDKDQSNAYKTEPGKPPIRAQADIYKFLELLLYQGQSAYEQFHIENLEELALHHVIDEEFLVKPKKTEA